MYRHNGGRWLGTACGSAAGRQGDVTSRELKDDDKFHSLWQAGGSSSRLKGERKGRDDGWWGRGGLG